MQLKIACSIHITNLNVNTLKTLEISPVSIGFKDYLINSTRYWSDLMTRNPTNLIENYVLQRSLFEEPNNILAATLLSKATLFSDFMALTVYYPIFV